MKNLSKEQITVIAVSVIAIIILAIQVITIDPSTNDENLKNKYKSSIDSVIVTDSLIKNFTVVKQINDKDIFNLKVVKVKKRSADESSDSVKVVKVKTKWITSNDIELYAKDKISYSFYFNGKARFTINGKTQEVKVGDVITVGNSLSKEVVEGSNEPTGNTKVGKEYSNKIISITERAVYIDTADKDRVIRFRPNSDATYFARNLMQDPNATEEDKNTKTEPADTRRNPRGGGR